MLPGEITFNGVKFHLAKADAQKALIAKGQNIKLPEGEFNRVYVLAASADGDQKATFEAGTNKTDLDIQDWSGYIGQWDDRQWSGTNLDVDHANYGQMTGLKQGFIKRADLAGYCDHHHDAAGKNVTYSYSYLFRIRDRSSLRDEDSEAAQKRQDPHSGDLRCGGRSGGFTGSSAL
jgi:alpha-mannosidase